MTVEATNPPDLKRVYPHVEEITDWQTRLTLRLLWDRIFDLEARLQAVLATQGDLVSAVNAQDDALTLADRKADEALALAQIVRGELGPGGGDGGGGIPGVPTIPDYFGVVQAVLSRYDPTIPESQEEEGKAQLTRAVAWEIFQTDPNIGLLEKTEGTNVLGLSVDLVVQATNGDYSDVASAINNGDGTVTILGTWQPHVGDSNTTDETRWVEPTLALAETAGPMALV